jgi:hypothetical protein
VTGLEEILVAVRGGNQPPCLPPSC